MTLVKYRNNSLFPVFRNMGSMFDHLFRNDLFDLRQEGDFMPAINISSDKDGFLLSAELPGVRVEDIKVDLEDGVLTLSGEKKVENRKDEESFHRIERVYGQFVRRIRLPSDADADKVTASFENGILQIRIGKTETAKAKAIPIDAK